ncbi:MAG TPA: tetratricopeptide repeat protein [Deltaproteobacteria bacterium]|nr:tetratricopeptide repeat protein [Deltaproteobacteria bacterium]
MRPSRRSRKLRSDCGASCASDEYSRRDRLVVLIRVAAFPAAVLVLVLALVSAGCRSTPIREIRGARHYAEGTRALEASEPARAVEELERAAALVPEASEIQNHLGLAYWAGGRPERARLAFERALELDCGNDAARVNLANLRRSIRLSAKVGLDDGTFGKAGVRDPGSAADRDGGGQDGGR